MTENLTKEFFVSEKKPLFHAEGAKKGSDTNYVKTKKSAVYSSHSSWSACPSISMRQCSDRCLRLPSVAGSCVPNSERAARTLCCRLTSSIVGMESMR